jgi:hypothetical protein
LWAGPEKIGRSVREGGYPVQGTVRSAPVSLKLGFGADDFSYSGAAAHSQIIVVSHSRALMDALGRAAHRPGTRLSPPDKTGDVEELR